MKVTQFVGLGVLSIVAMGAAAGFAPPGGPTSSVAVPARTLPAVVAPAVTTPPAGEGAEAPKVLCGEDRAAPADGRPAPLDSQDNLIREAAFDEPQAADSAEGMLANEIAGPGTSMSTLRTLRFASWQAGPGSVRFVGFDKAGEPRGHVSVVQGGQSKSWLTEGWSVCNAEPVPSG